MRRLAILLSSLALMVALGVTLIGPASSVTRRADLAVSDLAEPPEVAVAGTTFRQSVSVANLGNRSAKKTTTRFFLDLNPNNSAGRRRIGSTGIARLSGNGEESKRVRLRIPGGLANGDYFLVACADTGKKLKEAKEANNCRVSGQTIGVGLSRIGPQGPPGVTNESTIEKFTLPIGRPTIDGFEANPNFGDDEKSTQRREFAKVGPVSLVADCKRTTNGDEGAPDDPVGAVNDFDDDGDEAKVLVYTDTGTLTFNSVGESSRRNIPAGEGATEDNDPSAYTQAEESDGGEGAHMAIAAARDPDQAAPGGDVGGSDEDVWAFAYKVHTIYISHSNGTELIFTGFAGIDVLAAEDQCVFGGVLKVVRAA